MQMHDLPDHTVLCCSFTGEYVQTQLSVLWQKVD